MPFMNQSTTSSVAIAPSVTLGAIVCATPFTARAMTGSAFATTSMAASCGAIAKSAHATTDPIMPVSSTRFGP
jgi:hypothetical protein